MRIGMIFDNKFRSYTTGNYCYKSVQKLGYDAIHFNPLVIKNTGITYDYTGLPECDLYISIDDDFAYPGPPVPKEISAYWCIDTHRMELMAGGNLTRWQKIKHFGHVFMAQKDRAEEIGHVWLPLGYDPDISRSLNLEKVYDWCFVGSLNSPIRNSYIPILRDKFPNCYVGQAEPIEMNHIYNQSRVVLNLPSLNDLNMRFFEAVASGSLCLSKRITNGIDEIFGNSIILFDNARDMCAKMNDILRFYNFYVPRTKRDWLDHTYDSRMAKMISIIKERLRTGTIC